MTAIIIIYLVHLQLFCSTNQSIINQSITLLKCQVDQVYIYANLLGHLTTSELKVKKKYINRSDILVLVQLYAPAQQKDNSFSTMLFNRRNLKTSSSSSVYSHLFTHNINLQEQKRKKERKVKTKESQPTCTQGINLNSMQWQKEQSFRVGHYHSAITSERWLLTEFT